MKNGSKMSSILLMGFILFGVVFIQVGYAALETSFYISGEANIKKPLRKLLYTSFDSIGWSDPPRMLLYLPMDGVGYVGENMESELNKRPFTDSITGKNFNLLGGSVIRSSTKVKVGNRAGYFSGVQNQRINIKNPELNFGTKDFTISFWLNPDMTTTGEHPMIFTNDDNDKSSLRFYLFLAQKQIRINSYSLPTPGLTAIIDVYDKLPTPNEWSHWAVVRKDGVFSLYENGVKIGENDSLKGFPIDLSDLSIGGNDDNRTAYRRYIDDFVIYNKAIYDTDFMPPSNPENN